MSSTKALSRERVAAVVMIAAGSSLIGSCAHSGVVKVGPDTYMIANSEWGFTSGGYQAAKAINEGAQYCTSIGREILVLNSSQNDVSFGKTPAAQVRFRCLLRGDPELTRPAAQKPRFNRCFSLCCSHLERVENSFSPCLIFFLADKFLLSQLFQLRETRGDTICRGW